MAKVTLELGGNSWAVNCRDGEEAQVRKLGQMIGDRWEQAQRAAGDAGSARVMLLVALMLADELVDAQHDAPPVSTEAEQPEFEDIADRLEKLADALEREASSD